MDPEVRTGFVSQRHKVAGQAACSAHFRLYSMGYDNLMTVALLGAVEQRAAVRPWLY